jgi:hypothetical protein
MNDVPIVIVTPQYLQGGPVSVNRSSNAYGWRRKQNLTALHPFEHLNDRPQPHTIDAEDSFNYLITNNLDTACNERTIPDDINGCSQPLLDYQAGLYSKELGPYDCLTEYADPFGSRASLLIITDFDYLSNQSTSVVNFTNSVLFARSIYQEQALEFWGEYHWLCGNTNSFDCKLSPSLHLVVCKLTINPGRPNAEWKRDPDITKDWNMLGWRVDKCLVAERPLDSFCKVNISVQIMIGS